MLTTCKGEVLTLGPDEGTPAIGACDGIVSPRKAPSSLDTTLERVSGSGNVIRAGVAELAGGGVTEGGCAGRDMGNGTLVLCASTAVG